MCRRQRSEAGADWLFELSRTRAPVTLFSIPPPLPPSWDSAPWNRAAGEVTLAVVSTPSAWSTLTLAMSNDDQGLAAAGATPVCTLEDEGRGAAGWLALTGGPLGYLGLARIDFIPEHEPPPGILSFVGFGVSDGELAARTPIPGMVAGFRRCHERVVYASPDMEGTVTVTARLSEQGSVTVATASRQGAVPAELAECLRARVAGAAFDLVRGAPTVVFAWTVAPR